MYRHWGVALCFKAVNVFFELIRCCGNHLDYARVVGC